MKIAYFPHQAHCYAYGGFEIQMREAADAVRAVGVDVVLQDCWSTDKSASIVHHWGMGYSHVDNIRWAKKMGQKIVITALLPYYDSCYARMRGFVSRRLGESRLTLENFKLADAIVVVNELQADVLVREYRVSFEKIKIIPNIINDFFFQNGNTNNPSHEEPYWVCAGNICKRKNQLNAARAAIAAGVKLRIIGNTLIGEEAYFDALKALVNTTDRVEIMGGFSKNDPRYLKLLSNAVGLLLPSYEEQQPIIALEMLAMKKQVIMADRIYAYQKIFSGAIKADPNSFTEIASFMALDIGISVHNEMLLNCSMRLVGTNYAEFYNLI